MPQENTRISGTDFYRPGACLAQVVAPDHKDRQVTAGDYECKAGQPGQLSLSVHDG